MTALITAALIAAVWAGMKIPCENGLAVTLEHPMKSDLLGGAAKLFLPELTAAAILSLCNKKGRLGQTATAAVFAFRGVAAGYAVCFCRANSANAEMLSALVASCAATLLFAAYAVILTNAENKSSPTFKMLCYLAVSGAACALKAAPYLFL